MQEDKTIHIPVEGMSCASCAMSIENTLKHVEGVKNARVNFANQTATIDWENGDAALEKWREEIKKLGFDLRIDEIAEKKNPLNEKTKPIEG